MREALPDLAMAIEPRQVLRRRDQREIHRPALRRLSGLEQLDVATGARELLEVLDRLIVGSQLVVGARREPEDGLRRRNRGSALGVRNGGQGNRDKKRDKSPHRRVILPRGPFTQTITGEKEIRSSLSHAEAPP